MPRSKRHRVALGIYRDKAGYAAVARVGDWRKEKRFPLRTPLSEIKDWQAEWRTKRRPSGTASRQHGTFAADVDRYLGMVRHLSGWVSLRAELRAWVALYGPWRRRQITAAVVLQTRHRWLTVDELQPKTVNNRVAALARLWHRLDGRRASTPCDDVSPLATHKTPPVVITAAVVQAVYRRLLEMEQPHEPVKGFGALRDAKTRARFMVMATTGKRPSEIMRAQAEDVDLERRVWNVRDGKGGWSPGVYLNDEMIAAWQTFIAAKAWGSFRSGALVRTIRSAGWPAGIRPYNLRHTVGIVMSESGVDLADIQQHMGHKRIDTTRRHYVPVLGSRLQRASELIDGRFGWTPTDKPKVGTGI